MARTPPSSPGRRRLLRDLAAGGAALAGVTLTGRVRALAAQPGGVGRIEPRAGAWQTWALESGRQMRLPPPPGAADTETELAEVRAAVAARDPAALDQAVFWDAGAPVYRWIEIALNQLSLTPNTPRSTRMLALVAIAIYDATVAAWDSKYAYNRVRPFETDPTIDIAVPAPRSPSYPCEHSAAAGAAAAVLAALFPEDARVHAQNAEAAAQSRVSAGVQYPSDVRAGLELGRAVAARVLERARADGSDAPWTGTIPTGPGMWVGSTPEEPQAARWATWALQSPSQFRPPPPPAHDSARKLAELAELKSIRRGVETDRPALDWATLDGLFSSWYTIASLRLFEYRLDTNAPRAARAYALLAVTHYDATIACWDSKYAYWAARPVHLDPQMSTLLPTPSHPTYVAGHSCLSAAAAAMLAYLFPREAESVARRAEEAGLSRLWAGVHFRSDHEAGVQLGRNVARWVSERADRDGSH